MATVVLMGGAVAAVCGSGVVFGSRLAPTPDATRPRASEDVALSPSTPDTALRDRVEDRTAASTRPPGPTSLVTPPGRRGDGTDAGSPSGTEESPSYRAVWPYATWAEVRAHADRGDPSFATPDGTALRFAREVVGMLEPTAGVVRSAAREATVEVRTAAGTTAVSLVRPDLPGNRPAPWGVVTASGDVSVAVDAVLPSGVSARVRAPARTWVGLNDLNRWRGVALSDGDDTTTVRVAPGAPGPAALVALGGDPRDPSAFALQKVELGPVEASSGSFTATASARALAASVAAGDLTEVWDRLGEQARGTVLDWRGLAARWVDLSDRLQPFATAPLDVAAVSTPAGPLRVVVPSTPPTSGPARALVFGRRAGASVLASLDDPQATWSDGSASGQPTLTVRGPSDAVLVVDGEVVPSESVAGGSRTTLTDLPAGEHVVVAVFLGREVSVDATVVITTEPDAAPPLDPPTTTTAPEPASTTAPSTPSATGAPPGPTRPS